MVFVICLLKDGQLTKVLGVCKKETVNKKCQEYKMYDYPGDEYQVVYTTRPLD